MDLTEEKETEEIGEEKTIDPAGQRAAAFVRLAIALAFVVTVTLIATGVVDADALEAAATGALAIAGLMLAWWKDNNVTLRAIMRHAVFGEIEIEGEE